VGDGASEERLGSVRDDRGRRDPGHVLRLGARRRERRADVVVGYLRTDRDEAALAAYLADTYSGEV
jgi:hypothetical protein